MESHTHGVLDALLRLHNDPAAITVSQTGTVDGTPDVIHPTGPGAFDPNTVIVIAVESADDTDGDETYAVQLRGRYAAGAWEDLGTWSIPRGTVNKTVHFPVSNMGFAGLANDEIQVFFTLGGTTPSLLAKVRLSVLRS